MPQRQNHGFICGVTVCIQTKTNGCVARREKKLMVPTQYAMQSQRGSRGIAVLILKFRARWVVSHITARHATPHGGGCTLGKVLRYPLFGP